MKRRDFLKTGAMSAMMLALGPKRAHAGKAPTDHLPILDERMAAGEYVPHYEEPEITEPGLLCGPDGRLNPEARGWSRRPLLRCNLAGHWPRKKKWNYWCFISREFAFSITLSDIDYIGIAAAFFYDFETGERIDVLSVTPFGRGVDMPEEVEADIRFRDGRLAFSLTHVDGGMKVDFEAPAMGGCRVRADFLVHKPTGHETLNIVVPWRSDRFQCNSKHNTLPCEGTVSVDGRVYRMDPEACHGVLDFGRGMWPYRSCWNWAVATGKQGVDTIGVNMGARWTTGTGANENGFCVNGRLYKVMEDLVWEYDDQDWMGPWRIHAPHTGMLDMTLVPMFTNAEKVNLGPVSTRGDVSFGRWSGVLRFDGRTVEVDDLPGWAEEFVHRW